jgi:hypothetical protein
MTLKAAQLPETLRHELLEQLRGRLGSAGYQSLVDRYGEETVLDLALQHLSGTPLDAPATTGRAPVREEGVLWKAVGPALWTIGWMLVPFPRFFLVEDNQISWWSGLLRSVVLVSVCSIWWAVWWRMLGPASLFGPPLVFLVALAWFGLQRWIRRDTMGRL